MSDIRAKMRQVQEALARGYCTPPDGGYRYRDDVSREALLDLLQLAFDRIERLERRVEELSQRMTEIEFGG